MAVVANGRLGKRDFVLELGEYLSVFDEFEREIPRASRFQHGLHGCR